MPTKQRCSHMGAKRIHDSMIPPSKIYSKQKQKTHKINYRKPIRGIPRNGKPVFFFKGPNTTPMNRSPGGFPVRCYSMFHQICEKWPWMQWSDPPRFGPRWRWLRDGGWERRFRWYPWRIRYHGDELNVFFLPIHGFPVILMVNGR